ncbi:MAG: hypothetical protein HQ528_03890 [Candidatus Marinimicrobia bacterium]|nr:hypothetical protein [Candidatus Neomarinimicrobiota bacterium]
MKSIKSILVISLCLGLVLPVFGQSLEETLETMAKENAKGYLGPVVTAFGLGVNSGTFHTAKSHSLLGFDFKLGVSMTMVEDAGTEYNFAVPDVDIDFDVSGHSVTLNPNDVYETDRTSATFFGANESYDIEVDETAAIDLIAQQISTSSGGLLSVQDVKDQLGTEISSAISQNVPAIKTPVGFDLPAFPMVMPQFSLGLPMDIELTLRGFPSADLGDAGELSFFGFGGKIGLNQFVPVPIPFLPRVAVGYYMTSLKIGDMLESNHSIATLQVSKSIPFITVYGGFGLESSDMDVSYTYTDELTGTTIPIAFSLEGDNSFRTIVGMRLKLAVISINADYNIGEYPVVNLGVGLTLR